MLIFVNIELTRSLYLNMQHGSQWQCIQVGGQHSHVRDRVSCLRDTTKQNQMSSQYACQAMVEYALKLNRSFDQLVHNFRIDLEILSHKKRCGTKMAQMDHPLQLPSVAQTLERSVYICFI